MRENQFTFSYDTLDCDNIEEIDLSETAMRKRMFKKFYNKPIINQDDDCSDLDNDDDIGVDVDESDLELLEEDME